MADTPLYNTILGVYCITQPSVYQRRGESFELCMSTKGTLLSHPCAHGSDVEDVAYQWSKDPGFSHLKAEEIRQGIKQIRDSSGKSASEQNATAEQVATVGRMAQNEATEVVTALAKTKADHAKEIAALRTNLSQAQEDIASLQDSPENLGSEIPAIKEDLLQVRDILSDLQNGAYTAANEMTTLRSITDKIEPEVNAAKQDISGLQATTSDLQRAMQNLAKEVDLLSVIAKQNVEVNESKKLCTDSAVYMGQIKAMLEASQHDRETIAALLAENERLKQQQKTTAVPTQSQPAAKHTATVDALIEEMSALRADAVVPDITMTSIGGSRADVQPTKRSVAATENAYTGPDWNIRFPDLQTRRTAWSSSAPFEQGNGAAGDTEQSDGGNGEEMGGGEESHSSYGSDFSIVTPGSGSNDE